MGGDLALSDDSSEGESEEVDSDSDSEESEEEQYGDPDQDVEHSDRKTREEVKLDQPFKQGWMRECLMDGKKVQIDTNLKLLQITYSRCVTKEVGATFFCNSPTKPVQVLRVYYLSPAIGPSKVRRRMRDKRSIAQFLSK